MYTYTHGVRYRCVTGALLPRNVTLQVRYRCVTGALQVRYIYVYIMCAYLAHSINIPLHSPTHKLYNCRNVPGRMQSFASLF